jgi:hypothetical protein
VINSRRSYLGIDPGMEGGLVLLAQQGNTPRSVRLARMPSTDTDIVTLLMAWCDQLGGPVLAALECISPGFPGTGKSSMAKLYGSYRGLRMALAALRIPTEEVRAVTWQSRLGVARRGRQEGKPQWKARLRQRAQQLFPFVRVTAHTADALLIAEYRRRLDGVSPVERLDESLLAVEQEPTDA